jgi:molybdopterin-guanine dinucleotide biosynthesis protein
LIVIVGGQGRNSGKTTAVCEIIAATQHARWTAIKLTAHAHGADLTEPVVLEEREAGATTDTARYLAAGAHRAFWVRCRPADIAPAVTPLIEGNVIIESNSAAGVIQAELIIFIRSDSGQAKPSAERVSSMADLHVSRIDPVVLERVRSLLSAQPL